MGLLLLQSKGRPKIESVWVDELIDNGDHYPSLTRTPQVEKYENFQHGWIIHWSMDVYAGDYLQYLNSEVNLPPHPNTFAPGTVDIDAWADEMVLRGVDYAVLTVSHVFAFSLFPTEAAYNTTGLRHPTAPAPYCVQPGYADLNIMGKFCDALRARNIEPCAYICLFIDIPFFAGQVGDMTYEMQLKYVDWKSRYIQELLIKYGLKYLWYDTVGNIPQWMCQKFYNAAKAIDPEVTIIGNVGGEMNFGKFPYDIESTEEYVIYGGNTAYQTTARTFNGTTYYVGQEIVATPYGTHSQWFDYTPPVNVTPPYTLLVAQTYAEFQEILDEAKLYNRPFLANMMPDKEGNLLPHTLNYYDNIDFSRP